MIYLGPSDEDNSLEPIEILILTFVIGVSALTFFSTLDLVLNLKSLPLLKFDNADLGRLVGMPNGKYAPGCPFSGIQ